MKSEKLFLVAVCVVMASASAVRSAEPLPYYDIRLDASGLAQPFVQDALATVRTGGRQQTIDAGREALLHAVPDARVDAHEFFGTPHWVGSTSRFLTAPVKDAGATPRGIARTYVADHAGLFEIDAAELDRAVLTRDFKTDHNGVTHLTFQQQLRGIDLYGCEVLANVTRDGALINISSSMLPRPAGDFQVMGTTITALDAIRAGAANVGITMTMDLLAAGNPTGVTMKQIWKNTPDFRSDEPITSELIYFPLTRCDIRPAWSVLIPEKGIGNTYEMMIDATNGQVLRRWNRLHFATTEPASYRVYTSDSPAPMSPGTSTPSGAQAAFVPQQMLTINPADISAINVNGWIDDGVNETRGNNCDAHLDLDSNNSPDLPRPSGTPYRVFNFTHDPALEPTTAVNRNVAVTQLFYLANRYHDKLWSLGFNEAAKNFQINNFGRGGAGNDPVQADAQDGSGTNNANFSSSGGDGTSARMQMYVFNGPTPDRDGDVDADIVFHELSHGLSTRLSNGTVSGVQSGGMGEGWGDFFGLALNSEAADDPQGTYPAVAFVTYRLSGLTTNYYSGIRRFPYSTDLNKNPTTYADIDDGQVSFPPAVPISPGVGNFISSMASEVHNVGDVWCNMLWEARANFISAYGFAGNDIMMQLVVDGLKLEASNPNFLQARDGILQADLVNNGGANAARLWRAFAKRGCGPLATSPSGSTSTGVVESFSLYTFTYPDGLPTQLQPGVPTIFRVQAGSLAVAAPPVPGTGTLYYSVNGGAFVPVTMGLAASNIYVAILPPMNCLDQVRYYVQVGTQDGFVTDPSPSQPYTATVYNGSIAAFADNFETNMGWTVNSINLTTGAWVRVDPNGTVVSGLPAQPENDNSQNGTFCFVTGQGAVNGLPSAQDVDGGPTVLTSPLIDLSAPGPYALSYARWFYSSGNTSRSLLVELSNNNGGSWTTLETVPGTTAAAWVPKFWQVNSILAPTAQMRLRFTTEDNPNTTTTEGGVDDVVFSLLTCTPPGDCTHGDINGDLLVDGRDIQRFTDILINGGATAPEICSGDLQATPNTQVDLADVDNFVSCLLAGGC